VDNFAKPVDNLWITSVMSSKVPKISAHPPRNWGHASDGVSPALLSLVSDYDFLYFTAVFATVFELRRPWQKGRFSDQSMRTWSFPRGSALPHSTDYQAGVDCGPASRPYAVTLSSVAGGAVCLTAFRLGTFLTGCRPRMIKLTVGGPRRGPLTFVVSGVFVVKCQGAQVEGAKDVVQRLDMIVESLIDKGVRVLE